MIKLTAFHVEHLEGFNPKFPLETMKADLEAAMNDYRYELVTLWKHPENKVLAIAGLFLLRRGVGEVFTIPGVMVDHYPYGYFKSIKRMAEAYLERFEFHRLQMTIAEGWDQGRKWAKKLGFKEEGFMEKYGPNGESEHLFARVV